MPLNNSDSLRKRGKDLKRRHPEFRDFTDLEVGKKAVEAGIGEESTTSLATVDIPNVFPNSPAALVPASALDKVAAAINNLDPNMPGIAAWFYRKGACYRTEYFDALQQTLVSFTNVQTALGVAKQTAHSIAEIDKRLITAGTLADFKDQQLIAQQQLQTRSAQKELEFLTEQLEAGHAVKISEFGVKVANNRLAYTLAEKAATSGVDVPTQTAWIDHKRRQDLALEHKQKEIQAEVEGTITLALTEHLVAEAKMKALETYRQRFLTEGDPVVKQWFVLRIDALGKELFGEQGGMAGKTATGENF